MNRKERIVDLKQRMVAKYGSCLIAIPEDTAAFPVIKKDDSSAEREEKLAKKQQVIEAREQAYKQKVPEMMMELDRIIARIRSSRSEQQPKVGVEGVHSTSTAAMAAYTVTCEQCGNRDPNNVITDGRRGDRICAGRDGRGCGAVLEDHIEVQGADRRNHEGEDDKRQFGPAPNKLFGDAANMETSLNIEMKGTGRDNSAWKRIAQAQQSVEMGLSSVGKEEKHTREGYKTGHKRKAFAQLEVIASDMNIHMQVVQRAKEEFAKYRDVMEAVHNFHGVLLACLVLAFEEVSASSSLFERIEQKFVPIKDGGAAENAAFGRVRPRHEVTEDVAISAVPNVAMGKFSLDQVKEWLMDVAVPAATTAGVNDSASNGAPKENFTAEAALIVSYIMKLTAADAAEVAARAARRELPQSSIFGTVTVSNRLKRYRSTSTTSVGSNGGNGAEAKDVHSKAGLHLLRVANISAALHANSSVSSVAAAATTEQAPRAEVHFREAVIRRSQYDAALLEYERITALQQTRMRIEDQVSTNFQASVLQPRKPGVTTSSTTGTAGTASADGGADAAEESGQASKKVRTEPALPAAAPAQKTATAAPTVKVEKAPVKVEAEEAVDESFDFDLEELVGGKVASAATSKYANLKKADGGSAGSAAVSNGNGSHSSVGSGLVHVKSEVRSGGGAGVGGGAQVKTEPGSAHHAVGSAGVGAVASAGAGVKKVGMKPRPKIVIS